MLRYRIRPTVLGQSAEGYVNEYMKAHTQVTGEVEDARGDEVVEVGSGSGCPWLSQVRHLETSCLVASTAKSTMERLIPGCELAQLTINQIIWRSRTLELAVNTVVCLASIRCSGSTPCIHLMSDPWSSSFLQSSLICSLLCSKRPEGPGSSRVRELKHFGGSLPMTCRGTDPVSTGALSR